MGAFLPSVFCPQLLVRVNGQVPLEGKGVLEGPGPAVPQVPEVDIVVGGVPRQAQIGEAVEVHIPEVQGMKLVFGAEAGGGGVGRRRRDLGGGIGVEGTGLGQCVRGRDGLKKPVPLQHLDPVIIQLPKPQAVFPPPPGQRQGQRPAIRQGKKLCIGEVIVGLGGKLPISQASVT